MKKLVILLGCFILITGCKNSKEINVEEISHDDVISCSEKDALLNSYDDAYLIDVRTEIEYDSGHLDEAINISVDDIEDIKNNTDIKTDTPIIVYCRSGSRSATAAKKLKEMGYTNVYDLGSIDNCSTD